MVELEREVDRRWQQAREVEALLDAVAAGDLDRFRVRLERVAAFLEQDSAAWQEVLDTAVHKAAMCWSVRITELLIERGASLEGPGPFGRPALHEVANRLPARQDTPGRNGADVASLLLRHGADVNCVFGPKRTTPLHMAARRGNTEIARVLIEAGADIEAQDSNGETPLRRAVNCGHPALAAVLLAHGADRNTRCRRGLTPLDAARTEQMRAVFSRTP